MAEQTAEDAAKKAKDRVEYWLGQIDAGRKREKDWRKEGKRVLMIYNGQRKEQIPFNILYSNTETLAPALYNATPRPVVQRRFKDDDPLGKAAATAGVRTLEYLVDTNGEDYSPFDDVVSEAVIDALLPGRGISRVRYEADVVGAAGARYLKSELVCYESVKWDRCAFGFARKWKRVPWFAFEHDVELAEAKELFGAEKAAKLTFSADDKATSDHDDDQEKDRPDTDEDRKIAKVWEVWVRRGKKVLFVSPNSPDVLLKEEEDPLELTGFFPVPEPLRFLRKSNDLMPTALYTLYENQAKELNRLSIRINRVAEAIKVRGAYDSTITELDGLLKQDDNAMVGAQNVAALTEKGLEGAIWLMPIEKLIVVLQQLYIARQACKQVIYEITGISDILRGASVASETATAQNLKAQWGSLRLKRMQREVQRYARDMLRITLEIAGKRFQEQTFAAMTGLPYATTQEVAQANGEIAAARGQLAMSGQLPPEPQAQQAAIAQMVPAATAALSKPAWQGVLALLRDNTQRQYKIDIETNSTVDVEAVEDQKQMSEVLGAVSQFIQGVAPLVINGSMPFQVAQSMLLAVVRRYRMGSEIEDSIKAMQPPKNPDEGKQQAEQQKQAAEQKIAQDAHQMEMQKTQLELKAREQELAMEMEFKKQEHQLKLAEMTAKIKVAGIMAQVKEREAQSKLVLAEQQGQQQLEHQGRMAEQKESAAKAEAERKAKEPKRAPA